MNNKEYRKELNKKLYILAQKCLDRQFQQDGEAVRVRRDYHVEQLYPGKSYKDLQINELELCCKSLEMLLNSNKKEIASANQIQMLRFYAYSVALIYCNLDKLQVIDDDTGDIYSGEDLRALLKNQWATNQRIKNAAFRFLSNNWVNPRCNKFLVEGNFKKFIKNENSFYMEQLKPVEANYLIKRFSQIFTNANTDTSVRIADFRVN